VVIINADKIALTGNKNRAESLLSHSGYPGGIEGSSGEARP